ncbi:MAG: hypothetical protein Q4D27_08585 [Coriobacteriia bacterium]|nr:hypothetical protein [Coriobacteriia bacterium]
MRKRLSMVFVLALALAMAAALAGCACSASQKEAPAPETGEYQGTLVMALQEQMSVAGEDGDVVFKTTADTKYALGNMDEIYLDDIVSVKYHEENAGKVADEVDLVEHMDTALEFAGKLVDSDKDSLTLVSKSSTVTFQMDSETYLVGDLSQGDDIELTYLGNLNENPYANVVAVVNEGNQPETLTVHGAVSELAENTLLLGIDSAHAYRFNMTPNTKVMGAANDVQAGDQVDITYKGSIKNAPEALEINIVKQGQDRAYVINGKIADVAKNSVTLETEKAKYTFATNEYTKYNGDKVTKGYKAEITYTGSLNDKPVAGVVYCVKSDKAAKATAKKQQSKSTSAKKNVKSSSTTASSKSNASTTSSGDAEKKDQAKEGTIEKDEQSVEDSGESAVAPEEEATEPAADDQGSEEATEPEEGGNDPDTPEPEPDPAADEPEPAADEPTGDEPEDEGATDPEEGGNEPDADEPEPDPAADEPEADADEPAADEPEDEEATEPEEAEEPAAEEAEPEEADEPEEAAEPEAKPDVKVSGKGTIIKGDEKKHTVEIEMNDGTKVTLTIDKDTSVASGYIPEKGDVVKVVYGSESLTLKKIQLVNRADDTKAAKDEEKAADDEEAAKDDDEATEEK